MTVPNTFASGTRIQSAEVNQNFTQHDGEIAANTADIATNTADIATNTADIATNTADIATNTADIATKADAADLMPNQSIVPGTLMNFLNAGTSAAPMYMYLTGGGGESISMVNPATKTDKGWQAQVTNGAGNAARFGWNTGQNACGNLVDVYRLRGEYLTMGSWVYCTTASRVKLELSDGTTTTASTAYHAGGGWEWMTVTLAATVDAAATAITAYLLIEAGAAITAYMELPCVVPGTSCTRHVGYRGGGRMFSTGFDITGNGNTALTGCNFSPTAMMLNCVWQGGATWAHGTIWLTAATTNYYSKRSGGTDTTLVYAYGTGQAITVNSWDADGATLTVASYAANSRAAVIFFEGNPI